MSHCQRHTQDTTLVDDDDLADIVFPPFIPDPQPNVRTLVLCFDGTGDQFDEDNSNIVRFVKLLKKDDNTKQLVYYQAGIGTYTSPVFVTPFMADLSQALDAATAWNIHSHVISGYEFLVQNYRLGDKICIFGFSRGAYIARSLAGMIQRVGIIPVDNHQQIPFAHKMYTSDNWKQINDFKDTFSVDVDIEFVGVWDTVDSVGIFPKYFPLMGSKTGIRTFRHAISLDERRSKFNVNLWNRLPDKEDESGVDTCIARIAELQKLQIIGDKPTSEVCTPDGDKAEYELRTQNDRGRDRLEMMLPNKNMERTDIEEVWFAGCHCDVGGGSVVNETRYSLARIPLRWMIRECFKANTGILFDTAFLYTVGLDPATLYRRSAAKLERPLLFDALIDQARKRIIQERESPPSLHWLRNLFAKKTPISGSSEKTLTSGSSEKIDIPKPLFISEDDEDLEDALSPMYDQLKINRLWWIMELLPVKVRYQDEKDMWVSHIKINRGKARIIHNQDMRGVKVHRSVKIRMEAQHYKKGKKYKPKAKIDNPTWI